MALDEVHVGIKRDAIMLFLFKWSFKTPAGKEIKLV